METARTPLREAEFEKILHRNREVPSAVFQELVSDASAGYYGSATETLVTTVFLIQQSKESADDHCEVISSLQDCFHGIESKSHFIWIKT